MSEVLAPAGVGSAVAQPGLTHLRALVRSLPDTGVVTCDEDLRVVAIVGDLYRRMGADVESLVGRDLREVLAGLGLGAHAPLYEAALRGEQHDHLQPWGNGRTYLVRFGPVRDELGSVIGALTVASDVTAQHRAERERVEAHERLADERLRFRTAFESAAAGSAIATPDGVLVEVNASYAQIVGRPVEDLVGTRVADLTHPEDRPATRAYFRACIAGEGARDLLEKRFLRPDGSEVPALVSAALVCDEHGAPSYVTAQVIDLSARVQAERAAREARQRQSLILASLPGTVVALYDRELRVVETEGIAQDDPRGHTDASVRGAHLREFFEPEAYARVEIKMLAALAGHGSATQVQTEDGREFEMEAAPFVQDGDITGVLAIWRDVTTRKRAERLQRESDRQLRAAFDNAPIGMVMVGLDGRFTRCNDAICAITGRTVAELVALEPFAFVHPDDIEAVAQRFAGLGDEQDTMAVEHRILHAAGHVVWVQAQITLMRDDADQPLYVLAQVADVSERKVFEDHLRHMADTDPLTGLLNRRSFEGVLEAHVGRCRLGAPRGSLMVLDIDGFKSVNDTLGHEAGDEVIRRLAAVLSSNTRDGDVVARLGGDEFAVLLPDADRERSIRVATDLLRAVRGDRRTGSGTPGVDLTVSIGVRPIETNGYTAKGLMSDADLAMYQAKTNGRDGYASWDSRGSSWIPG